MGKTVVWQLSLRFRKFILSLFFHYFCLFKQQLEDAMLTVVDGISNCGPLVLKQPPLPTAPPYEIILNDLLIVAPLLQYYYIDLRFVFPS